ncbi:MAG: CBS domain-containing protein [Gammaproteobacteria bacterium]|nr:CBS domain-containing protein [Gammaproteobacteria bacterium]MBU1654637.1 CBS domain-containing protein [Gammaproteobacteria bacterium]MBU1960430.1 CBS domain-containing protein [Gammaproteobacteria bacterium]
MRKNNPISNIMTTDVASVQEGQPLSEVRHLMAHSGISHVPVLAGYKLTGLVSLSDLMKLNIVISGADDRTIDAIIDHQFKIADVMSAELVTLKEKDPIRRAAEILSQGRFHSVPVVKDDGSLAGIVTSSDLIRYLSDQY